MIKNKIRLFWWNEKYFHIKSKENYGDVLGRYLVEKISGKEILFSIPKKWSVYDWFSPIYVTIGSVLAHVNQKCIVWGSGIIKKDQVVKKAIFLAVRGPKTRENLMAQGYEVLPIYGDPALLLPRFYNPKVDKKFDLGIIPHYTDFKIAETLFQHIPNCKIIDLMTDDVEQTTQEILSCKKIISSSLHGVIVSHSYQIPAVWQKFSDKLFGDNIKYQDYMESVDLNYYEPITKSNEYSLEGIESLFKKYPNLPSNQKIDELCEGLLQVCPFKK